MRFSILLGLACFGILGRQALWAQETVGAPPSSADQGVTVPRLIQYSGMLKDHLGQPLAGVQGVTFAFYKEKDDVVALWREVQNVTADEQGRYSALLGASQPEGVPLDLFTSRRAQWLAVEIAGQTGEQPRVLLASVPYALVATRTEAAAEAAADGPQPNPSRLDQKPPNNAERAPAFEATNTTGPSYFSDATSGPPFQVLSTAKVANLNVDLLNGLHDTDFAKIVGGNTFTGTQQGTFAGNGSGLTSLNASNISSGVVGAARGGTGLSLCSTDGQVPKWSAASATWVCGTDNNSGGTVTNIASANGITGGPITSTGTLTLMPCPDGQILKSNAGVWACGSDLNSGGTITAVVVPSGSGLTGGGTSGGVSLSIDPTLVPKLTTSNSFTAPQSVKTNGSPQLPMAAGMERAEDRRQPTSINPGASAAVLGWNTATSGVSYGVFGRSDSPNGYGGGFQNTTPGGFSLTAFDVNDNAAFTVLGSGNVGIGTTAPARKLDVTGQINASAGLCINGDCKTAWPASGGTVTQVNSGTGLTGGPITTTGTLSLDTTFTDGRYALLGSPNSFSAMQTAPVFAATGNLSAGGSVSAASGSFTGNVTSGGMVSATGGGSFQAATPAGSSLVALDSSSNATLTAIGTGSVGIGVNTGLSRLTVRGKVTFAGSGTVSYDGATGAVVGTGTKFLSEVGVGDRIQILTITTTVTAIASDTSLTAIGGQTTQPAGSNFNVLPGLFRAETSTPNNSTIFRVTDQGNVQIGSVANAGPKLLVAQTNPFTGTTTTSTSENLPGITLRSTTTGGAIDVGPMIGLSGNNGSINTLYGGLRGAKENGTSGDLNGYLGFYTMQAGPTFAERMRLSSAGNLGIGTKTPAFMLDVLGGQINASGGLCMAGDCRTSWSAAAGAVTSVSAGIGLTASPNPITSTGTLSLDTSYTDGRYAQLGASNSFTSTLTISSGDLALPATTAATNGVLSLGGNAFAHGFTSSTPVVPAGPLDANTFLGRSAGNFTTTGVDNTGVGTVALSAITTGIGNTALGNGALKSHMTGDSNTAIGAAAMNGDVKGAYNTVVGQASLLVNNDASGNSGSSNTVLGAQSALSNTSGSANTVVGAFAFNANTTGSGNVAVGNGALNKNTTAGGNTAVGQSALSSNTTGSQNTAIGQNALQLNTTGGINTAIGQTALQKNTTGGNNTATGGGALAANTTGTANTATGTIALFSNTTGIQNTATGAAAMVLNTVGSNNTANGYGALGLNNGNNNTAVGQGALQGGPLSLSGPVTSGSSNTAVGQGALLNNMAGNNNTAVGQNALVNNSGSSANNNTAVGQNSMQSNQTGDGNAALGQNSLVDNTSGSENTALGSGALFHNATGNNNTAVGRNALKSNSGSTAHNNTAVGESALQTNVNGTGNTAVGQAALANNTADSNTAVGQNALNSNTNSCCNTAVGFEALKVSTGTNNTAVGDWALRLNTSGSSNTAVGVWALKSNTTGVNNTAVGENAMQNTTTGNFNTAFGEGVLGSITDGCCNTGLGLEALSSSTASFNTAVGDWALHLNTTGCCNAAVGINALQNDTTGAGNSALGDNALQNNISGNNNIAIGNNAGQNATTGDYNIYIGNLGNAGEGATIRIGDANQTRAFIAGVSGVTTGGTGASVLIDGNGQLGTISSSRKYKFEIQDMDGASSNLLRLRPVTFRYKQPQGDGSHPLQFGLIAEEVAEVYPELVQYSADGKVHTVLYHELPSMLLNEVQKQHQRIEMQEKRIQAQQEQLQKQAAELAELRARFDLLSEKISGGSH